jgi:para-nitrobenzyl esterase
VHKGIVQSGAGFGKARDMATAEAAGARWTRDIGISGTGPEAAQALRELPVERIAPPSPRLAEIMEILAQGGPIIDGSFLQEAPEAAIRNGSAAPLPMIIGNTGLESAVWSFPDGGIGLVPLSEPVEEEMLLAGLTQAERDQLLAPWLARTGGDRKSALALLATAARQGLAARELAAAVAKRAPAYLYHFDAVPTPARPVAPGAPHGTDIFYVFSTLHKFRYRPQDITPAEHSLAATMTDYWAEFARSTVPGSRRGPSWLRYRSEKERLLAITNSGFRMIPVADRELLARAARNARSSSMTAGRELAP